MDQLTRSTKRHGEAVIDGKDYSVGFTWDGSVCTLHRHIKFPDEKWTSISRTTPRFKSLAERIEALSQSDSMDEEDQARVEPKGECRES